MKSFPHKCNFTRETSRYVHPFKELPHIELLAMVTMARHYDLAHFYLCWTIAHFFLLLFFFHLFLIIFFNTDDFLEAIDAKWEKTSILDKSLWEINGQDPVHPKLRATIVFMFLYSQKDLLFPRISRDSLKLRLWLCSWTVVIQDVFFSLSPQPLPLFVSYYLIQFLLFWCLNLIHMKVLYLELLHTSKMPQW